MVVTTRPYTDRTTTLDVGDHPFLQHESNVDYGSARLISKSQLALTAKQGSVHIQPDMSPALLRRVCDGLLQSPRTIHFIKDFCVGVFGTE